MARLADTTIPLGFSLHPTMRGMYRYRLPFGSREFAAEAKVIPGVTYDSVTYSWTCPFELTEELAKLGSTHAKFHAKPPYRRPSQLEANPGERPYQLEARRRAESELSALLAFDTGLGKTRAALEASPGRTLVLCPAAVRPSFVDEISKWVPGASVTVVTPKKGKRAWNPEEAKEADFTVCSYAMFDKVVDQLPRDFETVIMDEIHYLKSYKAKRTQAVERFLEESPASQIRLGLSATPIMNTPTDLFKPIDLLWPGRLGWWTKFRDRYFSVASNGYGLVITGLRQDTKKELMDRVSKIIVRATKQEWAHLLPPLTAQVQRYEPECRAAEDYRGMSDYFMKGEDYAFSHADELFLKHMGMAMDDKVLRTKDLLSEAIARGERKIAVVSYHRSVNTALAGFARKESAKAANSDGYFVASVDGGDNPEQRLRVLKEAAEQDYAIVFATMESITEGLNVLAAFSHVILAELYYKPASVSQLLGRFHRFGQRSAVTVEIPIITGTLDDRILFVLKQKLEMMNDVLRTGASEQKLLSAFGADASDWRKELLGAVL